MVTVSYRSQRVSSFQSSFSTEMSANVSEPFYYRVGGLTELADTLEGELVLLDEDPDRVTHEFLCHLKNVRGHGSGKEDHLGLSGKELEDIIYGVFESGGEHLIRLVEAEHLD